MSSLNRSIRAVVQNHAGASVRPSTDKQTLVRLVMANMLWEGQFYMNGQNTADMLSELVHRLDANFVSKVAIVARNEFKLRHVPLLLTRELARTGRLSASVLAEVIQRPDEMAEFLALYWKDKKQPLSNQVKKGLALAFTKFNEYQLAKWDKNSARIALRDVMFLVHPKPADEAQARLFEKVAMQRLSTPDTWETELSRGADKCETFTRLMEERKLGALAFIRNLRNMDQSGVSHRLINDYADNVKTERVLPFRFIAASKQVPQFRGTLERMMLSCLASHKPMLGRTALLIDVSGSMFGTKISAKSDLERFDAAAALAILCREVCKDVQVFSFSDWLINVSPHRGFALGEAISKSQMHGGTRLGKALKALGEHHGRYDRTIIFTDEQSQDNVSSSMLEPLGKTYIVNVAAYKHGVNHEGITTISGFSEAIVDYIQTLESEADFL